MPMTAGGDRQMPQDAMMPMSRLTTAIATLCPTEDVTVGTMGESSTVTFTPSSEATPAQIQRAQDYIDSFDWKTVRLRSVEALHTDLMALPQTTRDAIKADLITSNKIRSYVGINTAAILSLWFIYEYGGGLDVTEIADCEMYLAAMYTQDNTLYLFEPPFDPTINIPVWEVVP